MVDGGSWKYVLGRQERKGPPSSAHTPKSSHFTQSTSGVTVVTSAVTEKKNTGMLSDSDIMLYSATTTPQNNTTARDSFVEVFAYFSSFLQHLPLPPLGLLFINDWDDTFGKALLYTERAVKRKK
jgi:hypothetical protein